MKFGSLSKALAMGSALFVIGAGCGGFYAAPTVSPLMFLLPGLVQTQPALPQTPGPGQAQPSRTAAQADQILCDSRLP